MIKVLELFAGYGSQALGLENLGIEGKKINEPGNHN